MKNFVVYLASGQIVRSGICQEETFDFQAGAGEFVLEAEYSGNQYVENGQLVLMPQQPSIDYVFDYVSKEWVLDLNAATARAYALRDQQLQNGPDRINPMWWSAMSAAQQQAWTDYRQSLLDITDQPGFPADIKWPAKP